MDMAGAVRAKIGAFVYSGRFWQLVASLMHLKFGLKKPAVTLRTDRPRSVDAEGELATETPATFGVRREALTVMVPRILPPGHRGLSPGDVSVLSIGQL
jgi:hypothetical protein